MTKKTTHPENHGKKATAKSRSVAKACKEEVENELIVARKVQTALIPRRLPCVDGLEMASLYLPCRHVGGDLFDVIPVTEDVIAFVIFDVAGQGVASTLGAALAKIRFTDHLRKVDSPRVVIERVNSEIIRDMDENFFLTAFVGYLDLHDNKLTYSNAGHAYPIVYRSRDRSLIPLRTQGTFIGVFENGFYDEHSIYLGPGDWLLLFTDGVYRAFATSEEFRGRQRFEDALTGRLDTTTPKDLVEYLKEQCESGNGTVCDDDVTAVVVEVLTQSRRNQIKERLGFNADDPVYLQTLIYFEEMDRVAAAVLTAMDSFGYPDESIRKMKITLTELLVNAVYHGNKKDFAKHVTIGHIVDKEKTVVAIMDEGEGFNPHDVPDPTLPENLIKDCGRGLYIVQHYADKVEYNDRGNRVIVTKYHSI